MSSGRSFSEIASDTITAVSGTVTSIWGNLRSALSIWVLHIVGVTWELDENRNLYIYTVTLPAETLKQQLRAHLAEASAEERVEDYVKGFKPLGGKRELIGMISHLTSRQALENILLEMLHIRALQETEQEEEEQGNLREDAIMREAKRVAEGAWAELQLAGGV